MNKIILILLIAGIFIGCQDFLEEESRSQMTSEYYQTEQGMYEGVAGAYSVCREMYGTNMFRVNYYSDLVTNGGSENNSFTSSSDPGWGWLNDLFVSMHKGIMVTNRMIKEIGEPNTPTEDVYLAELMCLRAHFNQLNVEFWGRYTHFQDSVWNSFDRAMLDINQVSVEEHYKHIMLDIDFAIENLPTKNEISEFGRLTQGAAKAFKARFLLAIAGYSHPEYTGAPEHNLYSKLGYASLDDVYSEAKSLAMSVIDDYGYSLEDEYWKVFDESNQTSDEVIWSVQWTTDKLFNQPFQGFHRFGIGRTNETLEMVVQNDGYITAIPKSLVVTRLDELGNPYNYSMPAHSMYYGRENRKYMATFAWINMYLDDDHRKKHNFETVYLKIDDDRAAPKDMSDTVCYMPFRAITPEEDQLHDDWVASGDPDAYYLDGLNEVYDLNDPNSEHYGGPFAQRSRVYSIKKFYDRSRVELGKQDEGHENGIVIRLAEMYLIVAECNWKLDLGDESVYDALMPIWERSFDDIQSIESYKHEGVNLNFILDEYSRELGLEFNTWLILKRTRSLVDRILKNNRKSLAEANDGVRRYRDYVKEEHYIKALPLNQVNSFRNITSDMLPPGYDY